MSEDKEFERRTMLKLAAAASGSTLAPVALSDGATASAPGTKEPLVDDLTVTNDDEVERTFTVEVRQTAGNATATTFEEEVTLASGDSVSYRNAVPHEEESQVRVTLDDGRSTVRDSTVVGAFPLHYGFEVAATPDLLAIYSRHVDPGPNEWGEN